MLEHQKMLLQNLVLFPELFKKELCKSVMWLNANELCELKKWLKQEMAANYAMAIEVIDSFLIFNNQNKSKKKHLVDF